MNHFYVSGLSQGDRKEIEKKRRKEKKIKSGIFLSSKIKAWSKRIICISFCFYNQANFYYYFISPIHVADKMRNRVK